MNKIIEDNRKGEASLIRPDQIPNSDPIVAKTKFTVDTAHSEAAVIEKGVITARTGLYGFQPIFAREPLIAGDSIEV